MANTRIGITVVVVVEVTGCTKWNGKECIGDRRIIPAVPTVGFVVHAVELVGVGSLDGSSRLLGSLLGVQRRR